MKSFVLIAVAVGILASSNIGKLPPVLPQVMDDLSLTLVEGGWIASAFFAPSVLIGILVGAFGDAIGHKRALLIGISLLFIGGLIGLVSIGFSSLIFSRVIEGLGFITVVVSAPALIVQLTSGANQRLALGVWGAYMPSGLAIIFVISPLFSDPLGWRGLWVVLILIALILIILIFKTEIPNRSGINGDSNETHLTEHIDLTLSNRGPWLLFGCFFFYAIQWSVIMTWFPSFLIEERGIGVYLTSILSAVIVAANIPGNLVGAWFLKRNTPRVYLMVFAGITQVFATFIIFSSSIPDILRYCSCILFSGVGGLIPASLMAAVAKFAPTQAQVGTTNGLMVQGSNLGHLLAPPAAALIVSASGFWEDTLILMVGAAMLNVFLSILIGVWERSISFKGQN